MASIVRYDSKPVLKDPIFIEALPGIGDVGKVAGDFIAESSGAKRFASIYSEDFPPQVIVDDDCVAHMVCNELWHSSVGGRDVIFLRGDFQGSTPEGQFYLAQDVMNILLDYNVSRIVTLGGFGTGCMVENPRVLGAVSKKELKAELEGYGVVFSPGEPEAGILGATGLLLGLGKIYGIDSVCLMGETSGFFVDHKGALAIVGVLMKILGTEYDTSELKAKCVQIEELTAKVKEIDDRDSRDTLTYIR